MADFVGGARYPMELFALKVGDVGLRVWFYLVALRKTFPQITAGIPHIAKAKGVAPCSERTVKRALARLRELGLVRNVGYRFREDGTRLLMVREVYGQQFGKSVVVPIDVWPKLDRAARAPIHGGPRPKQRDDDRRLKARKQPAGLLKVSSGPSLRPGAILKPEVVSSGPLSGVSRGPLTTTPVVSPTALTASLREAVPAAARPAEASPSAEQKTPARKLTLVELLATAPWLKGKPAQEPLLHGHGGMPFWPTADELGYTRPPPPRIPAHLDEEEQTRFVWKWYRSACLSRDLSVSFLKDPLGKGSQNRRFFVAAREVFLKHDVRPGVWVAWQVDRILEKLPPSVRPDWKPMPKVVLSVNTLTQQLWLFKQQEPLINVARQMRSPAGEVLAKRFAKLEAQVQVLTERTPERITALVKQHFPEGPVEARRVTAEKSKAAWNEVRGQLERGIWIWEG